MNPKRRFHHLRDDDRWVGLPPSSSRPAAIGSPFRAVTATKGLAFLVAALVAVGLWVGLSGFHHAQPADPEPLPTSTEQTAAVRLPCTDSARLAPIGCSTYTAIAAGGVPGGTVTWTGAPPPSLTLRVLEGRVTALVSTGCNELTVPVDLSPGLVTPEKSTAMTARLRGGAGGAEERWVVGLLTEPMEYTLDGGELHLTAGRRTLDLTAVPATAPTRTAIPSPTATRPAADGCAPTPSGTPVGAKSALIADVDGDGRRDTEWALLHGGDLRFGITTASGATASATEDFAGGGDRSFVAGRLANGAVIAMPSEGKATGLRSYRDCALQQVRSGTARTSSADGTFGLNIGWNDDGGAAACIRGRLASLSWSADGLSTTAVRARLVDVTADGRKATLTGISTTIARHVDLTTGTARLRYTGVSCGTSPVLRF